MRKTIYNKYNGHCAYCGCKITLKQMSVDHIKPVLRGDSDNILKENELERGSNKIENLNPACKSCNSSKNVLSVEEFRKQLIKRVDLLRRDSSQFRILERYEIIKQVKTDIEFYFEKNNL